MNEESPLAERHTGSFVINSTNLSRLSRSENIRGLPRSESVQDEMCPPRGV